MFDGMNLQQQLSQLGALLGQQTPAPVPVMPATNQIDMVDGIEGARTIQQKMLAGAKHIVWDSKQPVFYVLQKDANGSSMRIQICRFTTELEPTMEEKYVTREDFMALSEKLDSLLERGVKNDA